MHSHLFLQGAIRPISGPLAEGMRAGNATLIAWALPDDFRWIGFTTNGVAQQSQPAPGELWAYFERGMTQMKAHLQSQRIEPALTPADVERALDGEPRVVLASEGGDFLEGDLQRLGAAYQLGLRHLQLVHYIRNPLGDLQTEAPQHGGLTEFGKQVVAECQRLGILVDLAHSTEPAVEQALQVARVPVIWSHSSLTPFRAAWTMPGWRARRLSVATARTIAQQGGVVGLWALAPDVGNSPEAYADVITKMIDTLGEDHVGFGTDVNGLGSGAMMKDYTDLRRVVDVLQARNMPSARLRKVAIENYARVLKTAMTARAS